MTMAHEIPAGTTAPDRRGRQPRASAPLADLLAEEFELLDVLEKLVHACVDADGSSAVAAGIVVRNPEGRLQVLAATDENSRLLGLFQLQRGEGPCIATMLSGEPVSMRDVTTDARASAKFEETAVRLGFQSMHAFPMCRRDERIGALSLFYGRPTVLSAPDTRALQLLADLATISVLHLRALRHSRHLSAQLQSALDSRVVIEQAKGMLSVAGDLDMKAAYARLRAYARNRNLKLASLAAALTSRELSLEEVLGWTGPPRTRTR
jgi:GAF domain-containing protein